MYARGMNLLAFATGLGLFSINMGCSTDSAQRPEPMTSSLAAYKVEVVAQGLEVPWGFAFARDGRVFVTERPGRLRVIRNGKLDTTPYASFSEIINRGEGGLMDVSLHPKFDENRFLYITYVANTQPPTVRIVRYTDTGTGIGSPKTIIDGIAAAMFHCGCRARFGPDGKLYITTGEKFEKARAQDMNDLCGKTLRLNDDGTIPKDNPFVGQAGVRPEIWSSGHRNAQGIVWHPETKAMYQSEHGPSQSDAPGGGDEINLVEQGKNYGWPIIHHAEAKQGLESPMIEYTPAVAPGSAAFCTGKMFPEWKNQLFVGFLRGEALLRLKVDGKKVIGEERMFLNQYGRIREVAEAPDGSIWFSTSNRDGRGRPDQADDRIFRLTKG